MPVTKYRSISEMPDDQWLPKGSEKLFNTIRSTWTFAQRTTRPRFPAGVYKHASDDEAQQLRDIWERENLVAHREGRSQRQ